MSDVERRRLLPRSRVVLQIPYLYFSMSAAQLPLECIWIRRCTISASYISIISHRNHRTIIFSRHTRTPEEKVKNTHNLKTKNGSPGASRTHNLLLRTEPLYPLSYWATPLYYTISDYIQSLYSSTCKKQKRRTRGPPFQCLYLVKRSDKVL